MSGLDAVLSQVDVLQVFPGNTKDAKGLEHLLGALEQHPALTPTHASVDERKRIPYDKAASIDSIVSSLALALQLRRTKAPRYTGAISTRKASHNRLAAHYSDLRDSAQVREVFEAATHLADTLRPEFAFVHPRWVLSQVSESYNRGIGITRKELWRCGLAQVHARTWFGPDLIAILGESPLLALPESKRTAWGGIQLDLSPDPWGADFETLRRRQSEVRAALEPLQVFCDYAATPSRLTKAAGWTPPPWDIR
jgi:hypothetical protein